MRVSRALTVVDLICCVAPVDPVQLVSQDAADGTQFIEAGGAAEPQETRGEHGRRHHLWSMPSPAPPPLPGEGIEGKRGDDVHSLPHPSRGRDRGEGTGERR